MKKIGIIFLFFTAIFHFGQSKIDFKEISKNVGDSTSKYFYERLVYKFVYFPASLDSLERKHLYYGQMNQEIDNDSIRKISGNFYEKVRSKNYSEAIPLGEAVLKHFPVNLEVLGLMVQCYTLADRENRNLPLRGLQFHALIQAIFENKAEFDNYPTFTVMSVADEYVVSGIENINLFQYRRRTEKSENGMYDHWKKGKNRISFHVIYDY